METLLIHAGRRDKLRPGDILGALTGEAGFSAADVGKIEIHDRFAYVAVSRSIAREALEMLAEVRMKNRRFRIERAP
jgi:ATP-independent RNA helicase DbpA